MRPRSADHGDPQKSRTTRIRSRHKRQRIITAAREIFGRHGFSKASIEDIARKAGTGKATLYYHFDGKEDMFRAVVQREMDLFLEQVQKAVAKATTATDKFRSFVLARYKYLTELKTLSAITHQAVEEFLPLAQKQRDAYFDRELDMLKEILSEGIADGSFAIDDVEAAALVMIAGLWGFDTVILTYGRAKSITDGLAGMVEVILRGLLRRE